MSTPYQPDPSNPQSSQSGQPGLPNPPGPQSGAPSGQQPGQPGAQGYGGYQSYGQGAPASQPTQQWHQPPPPPPNAPWGASGGTPHGSSQQNKNFFAKLFDLSFSEFVTPSVIKVVYILAMIGVVFLWLGFSIAAFQSGVVAGIFVLFVLGPLYALFLLIITRITFEFYVAVIRIAEDVREMKRGR